MLKQICPLIHVLKIIVIFIFNLFTTRDLVQIDISAKHFSYNLDPPLDNNIHLRRARTNVICSIYKTMNLSQKAKLSCAKNPKEDWSNLSPIT